MKVIYHIVIITILCNLISCEGTHDIPENESNNDINISNRPVLEAIVYETGIPITIKPDVVNIDTMSAPKKIKAGLPKQVEFLKNHPKLGDIKKVQISNSSKVISLTTGEVSPPKRKVTQGLVIHARQPEPVPALNPRFRDATSTDIQYLNVDQGMNSSYVYSILKDTRQNMWIGTYGGGLSRYDGTSFVHYTTGLGSNYIWCLLEDTKGNIWIGTNGGGVSMYDGTKFTRFTKEQGLGSNTVVSMVEDLEGNIWFGCNNKGGASKYDGESITHYSKENGLPSNDISSIIVDRKGDLWFGSVGGGMARFDGTEFTNYTVDDGLGSNTVRVLHEDSNGLIWIGTDGGGVCTFDGKEIVQYTKENGLSNNYVWAIAEDNKGHMWFGTEYGVSKFNGEYFKTYSAKDGIKSVVSLFADEFGNIWIGSDGGGLIRIDNEFLSNYEIVNNLNYAEVADLMEDSRGNIWISTNGGGLIKLEGNDLNYYTEEDGLSDNDVMTAFEDKNGYIWVGTERGDISKFDGETFTHYGIDQGLKSDYVCTILEDKDDALWLGSRDNGVFKFTGQIFEHFNIDNGLSDNRVEAMICDKLGNIWIASSTGGLSKYNDGEITHYSTEEGLSDNRLTSVMEDSKGNIWAGTRYGGVNRYNPSAKEGDSFTHYNIDSGLSSNSVWSVTEDKEHRIWLSTEKGINLLIPQNTEGLEFERLKDIQYDVYVYARHDGLVSLDFNLNTTLLDSKDRVWWGSGQGLVKLELNDFKLVDNTPEIQLNSIGLQDKYVDYNSLNDLSYVSDLSFHEELIGSFTSVTPFTNYPNRLDLSHEFDHLSFSFSAIDWFAPHRLKYSYMLEGRDQEWSDLTDATKVDYRNIPYGEYTFKVKAFGRSKVWSDTLEYSFRIRPPWWKTILARVLAILLFFGISVAFYLYRISSLQRQKITLKKKVNERTLQLTSTLNVVRGKNKDIYDQAQELKSLNTKLNSVNDNLELLVLKRTKELEVSVIKLKELNQEKDGIMNVVAHDLKSPFSNIKGLFQLFAMSNNLDNEQQSYLQAIDKIMTRGITLIRNLLDVNSLGTFERRLSIQVIDIPKYMKEWLVGYEEELKRKDQKLHILEMKGVIYTDKDILSRVLDNLMSNAIKFSDFGKNIWISFKVDSDYVIFSIKDEGPGMKGGEKLNLFKKFHTLSAEPTGGETSNGIGLYITKDLVNSLEGNIYVESTVGVGTEFVVRLPKQIENKKPKYSKVVDANVMG